MEVSDARRLKALEDENARLKKVLAEQMLDNAILKDAAAKEWDVRCEAEGGGSCLRGAWGGPAAVALRSGRKLRERKAPSACERAIVWIGAEFGGFALRPR
jgi:hypothetical protein